MSISMTINTDEQGGGAVVTAPSGTPLDALDEGPTMKLLAEAGFVLLRGFATSLDEFSKLVRRMSGQIMLDPARTLHDGVAQKVDAGLDALGLHCENCNCPFIPHLCWFFCEKAAARGSQTTVCDGYRVWDAFTPAARQAFLERDIVYSRHVEAAKWKSLVFHSRQWEKAIEDITLGDLLGLLEGRDDTLIRACEDGSIYYELQVPAARRTLFSSRVAFCNSILGPSFHYERPRITFAGGEEIPQWLMEEVVRVSAAMTEDIAWKDGDVVLIDNTRVMHGRRAILDERRTIYNALSCIARRAGEE